MRSKSTLSRRLFSVRHSPTSAGIASLSASRSRPTRIDFGLVRQTIRWSSLHQLVLPTKYPVKPSKQATKSLLSIRCSKTGLSAQTVTQGTVSGKLTKRVQRSLKLCALMPSTPRPYRYPSPKSKTKLLCSKGVRASLSAVKSRAFPLTAPTNTASLSNYCSMMRRSLEKTTVMSYCSVMQVDGQLSSRKAFLCPRSGRLKT